MGWALALILACGLVEPAPAGAMPDTTPALRTELGARLGTPADSVPVAVAGCPLRALGLVQRFYAARDYRPAWFGEDGPLGQAAEFVALLRAAADEGLAPADYHLTEIDAHLSARAAGEGSSVAADADTELLLSDAMLLYAAHLGAGRVAPEAGDASFAPVSGRPDPMAALEHALATGHPNELALALRPPQRDYERLRQALVQFRALAARGGWPEVEAGEKLRPGARDPRVRQLRARLAADGSLAADRANGERFDEPLAEALRAFQRRHGLAVDGVVGPATLAALNVSATARARQIALNMERWRWLPADLGARYIAVNQPGFELSVVENGDSVLRMRIVVGKPQTRTPAFSAAMTHVVLNPYWYVPRRLAVEDKLPLVRRDPHYLASQHLRLLQGWAPNTRNIDPARVDWAHVSPASFPYRLRQDPGPWNALGRVKFMLPNPFQIYLHDTPSRALFQQANRTFSSGCIRVEKPVELAQYLLRDHPAWPPDKVAEQIKSGETRTVWLHEPIPVHLLYWTAWVDETGLVQFRSDIYGRDERLVVALRRDGWTEPDTALAMR